jgi:hypothetical protein
MAEINNPSKRTFWKATNGTIVHEGFTDIDQVTTTGQPSIISDTDASTIFPALPSSGTLTEGDIYSYNGGMVQVIQTHERTIYAPEDTPALFYVYRANTEGMDWVANEMVEIGDIRSYNGKNYQCLQSHQTLVSWTPDVTTALWKKVQGEEIPVWVQPTGAHDAYKKGDRVHFPTINDPVYESLIDANVTVPNGDVPWNRYWKQL